MPRPLLVVLAAVFAGLTMLLVVGAAVAGQPLVLLAAVPLAMTATLMWYQGTGRLAAGPFGASARARRRTRQYRSEHSDPRTADVGASASGGVSPPGGASASAAGRRTAGGAGDPRGRSFREEAQRERRHRARRQARQSRGEGDGSTSRGAWDRDDWGDQRSRSHPDGLGGPTRAEAYDVLGLDPSASDDEVREAYREQVKAAHPDTEGGSAEAFQELTDAYERIVEE